MKTECSFLVLKNPLGQIPICCNGFFRSPIQERGEMKRLVMVLSFVLAVLVAPSMQAGDPTGFLDIVSATVYPSFRLCSGQSAQLEVELRVQPGTTAEETKLLVTLPSGEVVTRVFPAGTVYEKVSLSFTAPLNSGWYEITARIRRLSDGTGAFVPRWIYVVPLPVVRNVLPLGALPGQEIVIDGANFLPLPLCVGDNVSGLRVRFVSTTGGVNEVSYSQVRSWGDERVRLNLPASLKPGKTYEVVVLICTRSSVNPQYRYTLGRLTPMSVPRPTVTPTPTPVSPFWPPIRRQNNPPHVHHANTSRRSGR